MKITCGTDIIEIGRIKDSIEDMGERFLERVFTKKEIEYCESRRNQKYLGLDELLLQQIYPHYRRLSRSGGTENF